MKFYLYLLLITIFCSHDCKLETSKQKLANDITDYNVRAKDYHNQLKGMGIGNVMRDGGAHNEAHNEVHNNEVRNNEVRNNEGRNNEGRNNELHNNELHNNELHNNEVHKELQDNKHNSIHDARHDGETEKDENSAFPNALENKDRHADGQDETRNRRSKIAKFYKQMKMQDEGNRVCNCKDPQNVLRYEDQDSQLDNESEENNEGQENEEDFNVLNGFPYKRGFAAKRRLLKKLLAANSAAQNLNVDSNNINNKYAEDYTFDDNGGGDLNAEGRSNEISEMRPAGYILVPKQNKLIVLKTPRPNDQGVHAVGNGNSNDASIAHQDPISSFKSNVSSLRGGAIDMESGCAAGKLPNEAPMVNNEFKTKLKAEIINCTSTALDKHLKLTKQNEESSSSGEKASSTIFGSSDKQALYGQKNDLMNLNITINGVVMNDDKPREIRGNGTVKVRRPKDEMRERRFIKFPFAKEPLKKQKKSSKADDEPQCSKSDSESEKDGKECPHKSTTECPSGPPDAGLTPDKLSNEIVKMVSQMVRSNPHMKTLWPSLQTNRPFGKSVASNLRTTANCSSRKQVEDMLRKAMESVNDIIEKEVQSRSCVPLTKDLADFYEVILEMHAKQAKRAEQREQKLINDENFDKEPNDDECESDGPSNDQTKADVENEEKDEELHDSAIFDMMHLKRLELDHEMEDARHRRESEKRLQSLASDSSNSSLVRKLRQMYSPAFLKLNSRMESLGESENVPN